MTPDAPVNPDAAPAPFPVLSEEKRADLLRACLQKQAALSVRIALVFLGLLFALPLFNYFLPALAGVPVGGFTLTWLVLGVLLYPVTWVLSGYFIRQSEALEAEITQEFAR